MNDRSPELLAPAGNIEQALLSIESGCDAIYGGLKTWNARMRAENFSLEEYEKIMDICGNKGIKFYMTLNTLFTNEDVTNILRTFYRRQFTFPHSVIVADVGLLQMLSDEFPHINLHVSTQYGASNASDIQFLEQYNVSRVILARELALKEILNVRKVTNLELEVFGYGSQCICFSGQCLWSGITQECSGNRGRCVAPCRDFYQYNDSIGQFFYPQDINAVSIVKKFISAGIDSIKLEGRFRDAKKTAAVVKSFRDAIDNAFDNNYSISSESEKHNYYAGYLENRNPVHSMLNQINPRTELIQVPTKEYTDHDLIVPYDKNHAVCLGGEHASPTKYWYIKSFFGNKLTLNNNSISVELYFNKEKVLERINLFDNMGRQFSNMIERHDIIKSTVRNIVNTIVPELNFDIFQISSNRPEASEVFVNSEKLRIILRQFNHICQQNMKARMVTSYIELPTYNDYLQINTCDIFNYLRDKGYRNFIFDISSVDELKKFLRDSETDGNIVYRLPLLDFTNALNGILPYLYKKNIMATRWGHLCLKKQYDFSLFFADYTLNAWNERALIALKSHGIDMFAAHPEISFAYSKKLSDKTGVPMEYIYVGKIPFGYTRACFGEVGLCAGACGSTNFEAKSLEKGYTVSVFCHDDFGYRTIVPSNTYAAFHTFYDCQRRYILSYMDHAEIDLILSGKSSQGLEFAAIYGRSVL